MIGVSGHFLSQRFQISAATVAARSGSPDYLIQALGRWTRSVYQYYIRTPSKTLASLWPSSSPEPAYGACVCVSRFVGPGLLRRSIGDTCVVIDSEVPFYLASWFTPFQGTLGKGGAGWLSFNLYGWLAMDTSLPPEFRLSSPPLWHLFPSSSIGNEFNPKCLHL